MEKQQFQKLVEPHMKAVYNYILRRLPSRDDASDVMQETMLAAWRALTAGETVRDGMETSWLIGIARHKIADLYRQRYRMDESGNLEDVADFLSDPVAAAAFDAADEQTDIRAALTRLTDGERELVYLAYGVELPYAEIAALLQIPTGTVKSRIASIKTKLKKTLGGAYGTE